MRGNNRGRLFRLSVTGLCAGIIIAASAPFLHSARLARVEAGGQQAASPRYPAGLEWMAGPPPPGLGMALIKTSDAAVGLVYVDGMKTGQTVSTTIVALSKKSGDSSATEGLVVLDPAGKQHTVSVGKVITFALGAAPVFSLLKGGKTLGTQSIPTGGAPPAPAKEVLVQSNRITDIHGSFDGNAANSSAKIGNTPLKVIAETPTDMIVACPETNISGPVTIDVSDNGQQSTCPADAVSVDAKAPRAMKIGQRSTVEVVYRGLQQFRNMKPDGMKLFAYLVNETPQVATLDGKKRAISEKIDTKKINEAGEYLLRAGLTAVGPGTYRLVGSITLNAYGCSISCAGCDTFGYCDSKGTVVCYAGPDCGHGCTAHSGGPGCGSNWSCKCKFGRCGCP